MEEQSVFEHAIAAIDTGDLQQLEKLIDADPGLLSRRYHTPNEGYFSRPYLLWFIANNPIRHEQMPSNTVELAAMMISKAKAKNVPAWKDQLEYALGLVVSGEISKRQGLQIPLATLLVEAGAKVSGTLSALAHGNLAAAQFLLEKGAPLDLITAICLDLPVAEQMAGTASADDRLLALIGASLYGKSKAISMLIKLGTDVNGYTNAKGFHTHGTALHQAVASGSLESVRTLVEAGADIHATDKVYRATPLEWAQYATGAEETDEAYREKLPQIIEYLLQKMQQT